jgi:hypothetical protein
VSRVSGFSVKLYCPTTANHTVCPQSDDRSSIERSHGVHRPATSTPNLSDADLQYQSYCYPLPNSTSPERASPHADRIYERKAEGPLTDPFATFDLPTSRHAIWAGADIREELNQCGQWNGSFTLPGGSSWIQLFLSRVS